MKINNYQPSAMKVTNPSPMKLRVTFIDQANPREVSPLTQAA
jgi:hypothetical protein